jgi:hypothetical protein
MLWYLSWDGCSWRVFHHLQESVLLDCSVQLRIRPSILHMVHLFFSYLSVYTNKIFQRICFHAFLLGGGTHFIFNHFKSYFKFYVTHDEILVLSKLYYIITLISYLCKNVHKKDGFYISHPADVRDYNVYEVKE